jgi:hypothetical protein
VIPLTTNILSKFQGKLSSRSVYLETNPDHPNQSQVHLFSILDLTRHAINFNDKGLLPPLKRTSCPDCDAEFQGCPTSNLNQISGGSLGLALVYGKPIWQSGFKGT